MAMPRPEVPTPPLPWLRDRLAPLGLTAIASCEPLARPWVHANYRLRLIDGRQLLLRRRLADPGHDSFRRELAALSSLRASDLPVVRSYRILPDGLLPWPGALSDLLPGIQGYRLVAAGAERGVEVCQHVGRVMAELADGLRPTHGIAIDGSRFVASRATWRDEWTDRVWAHRTASLEAGTGMGPLGDAVWKRLLTHLPSLESAERFSLVHGDLHPSNLLFTKGEGGAAELSGVIDWEGAFIGDPLAEWVLVLELPDTTVGHVLRALGSERVEAVLSDPDALQRLEAYRLSRVLHRMAFAGIQLFFGDGGTRRGHALPATARLARLALDRPVRDQLEAALASEGPPGSGREKDRRPRVLFAATEALRFRSPVPARERAIRLGCALTSPSVEFGLSQVAAAGPQARPERRAPIEDREAWRSSLLAATHHPTALALLALTLEALDAIDWAVPDDVLRGLSATTRIIELSEPAPEEAAGKLASAVIALASRLSLFPQDDHSAARESLAMTWEDLTLFGDAPKASISPEEIAERWAESPEPDKPLLPILLWALNRAGDLPADPGRILGALGLGASE